MSKNKKSKVKQISRGQVFKKGLEIAKKEREKREVDYGKQRVRANKKMDYIRNILNGRYYFARCNMIADQLNTGNIKEKIDGCLKPKEYLLSEYGLMKMQAIDSFRNAHFAKESLMKDHSFSEKDIKDLEKDYYDGKVIRESYDDEYKKGNKAEFVNSSKD